MTEQVPVGARVRYHGVECIVRGHSNPDEHPDKRVRDPEVIAAEYPDGTGYELWPADVAYKFGNREHAVYWVRRKSFDVIE